MQFQCIATVEKTPYFASTEVFSQTFNVEAPDQFEAINTIQKYYEEQSSEEGESFWVMSVDVAINLNFTDFF